MQLNIICAVLSFINFLMDVYSHNLGQATAWLSAGIAWTLLAIRSYQDE